MQKHNETMADIRSKLSAGEPLSEEEQELYRQWLSVAAANGHEYMTWENLESLLTIRANKPTWEEVEKQQLARRAVVLPLAEEVLPEASSCGATPARRNHRWWMAAAVLLAAVSGLVYYYIRPAASARVTDADYLAIDRTVLVLADNTMIPLTGQVTSKQYREGSLLAAVRQAQLVELDALPQTASGSVRVITGTGDSCRVRLPDGSYITLNARSVLEIPRSFSNSHRVVNLSGEAWFQIAKAATASGDVSLFRTFTAGHEIVVRGTAFNVRSYVNDSLSSIALLSGRIELVNKGDTIPVEPGYKAVIGRNGHVQTSAFGQDDMTAWRNDTLLFEGATLRQIMRTLERYYPVHVVFKDEFPDARFDLAIKKPKEIATVLHILSSEERAAVRFTTEDSTIYVTR